ncbi:MAG: hypothetical protein WC251_01785 [Candidatus Izemoplasmatales bacterium]|jgi:hypothetical protein
MELEVKTAAKKLSPRQNWVNDIRIEVYAPYAIEQGMSYDEALDFALDREKEGLLQQAADIAENGIE